MRGFLHIFLLWREDKPVGLLMKKKSCLGRNCWYTAKTLPLLVQEYSSVVTIPWNICGIFLPILNVVGRKKGGGSPPPLLPFAASALGCHKCYFTLLSAAVCPHLDLCLLLQPHITLTLSGHVGLWGSMCCHVSTSLSTAHGKISV